MPRCVRALARSDPAVELGLEVELVERSTGRARSCARMKRWSALEQRPWPGSRRARGSASPAGRADRRRRRSSSVGWPPPRCDRRPRDPRPASRAARRAGKAAAHAPERCRAPPWRRPAPRRPRASSPSSGGDHPAAAGLAVADRDLLTRLPEVELEQLAGPVDGALEGPRRASSAGAARARSRRGSSCRPDSRARDQLADHAATGSAGRPRSSSRISALNGSSFEGLRPRP